MADRNLSDFVNWDTAIARVKEYTDNAYSERETCLHLTLVHTYVHSGYGGKAKYSPGES